MFTEARFTIVKRWEQLKCPSMDEWTKKLWSIHAKEDHSAIKRNEVLIHVTMWMNFETVLNERSQAQKVIYCMILFI